MPNGTFLGSIDQEFARRATLDHYEPDSKKLTKGFSKWQDFFIDVINENKTPSDITDEELEKWFIYERDKVEFSKSCLVAIAHCETCAKPDFIKRSCPGCPYRLERFIL